MPDNRPVRGKRLSRKVVVPSYSEFAPSSTTASQTKQQNRASGGVAELTLRQAVWRLGLRYRIHVRTVLGRPDIVFPRAYVCVFCDGDFWHGRDWKRLEERLHRGANRDYWVRKIARNRQRDAEVTRSLRRDGWMVLRYWETDIAGDPAGVARGILRVVRQRLDGSLRDRVLDEQVGAV